MACSHADGCPLFPLLNESLRGWRDYYCDSDVKYRECARYKHSLTGQPVPITLLPNGATANLLSGPAPARPPRTGRPRQSVRSYQPSPAPRNPPAQKSPRVRRRWWNRLADWIAGPA